MNIGQLAGQAGVSIDTIRFWERRGVLPAPQRAASGYRVYTESTLARIRHARRLQNLGLSLDEIIGALHAHDEGHASCDTQRWRLEAVLDRIEVRIDELVRLRAGVRDALADCDAGTCQLASAL